MKCNLCLLQVEWRAHVLLFESCIAVDLPCFVPDFDFACFDKLVIGFERCLDQPIIPPDKQISFFYDVTDLHRNFKNANIKLGSEEHSVELFYDATASDDLFKGLFSDRDGFYRGGSVQAASLSRVGGNGVKNGPEHEKTKQATDGQEDHPLKTFSRSTSFFFATLRGSLPLWVLCSATDIWCGCFRERFHQT